MPESIHRGSAQTTISAQEDGNGCATIVSDNQLSCNEMEMDYLQTRFANTALHTQDDMTFSHTQSMMITDSEQDADSEDSDSADLDAEITYLESVVSQLSGSVNNVMPNPWHADIPRLVELHAAGTHGSQYAPGAMMASPCLTPISPFDARRVRDMQFHGCSLYPSNTVALAHSWPHPVPQSLPAPQYVPMNYDMAPNSMGHDLQLYPATTPMQQYPYPPQQPYPQPLLSAPSYAPTVSPIVVDDVIHLMGALNDYMTGLDQLTDLPSS